MSVVYEAPWLFVEARGVSVTEVLRAIGAKVGFAVVEAGAPRESLTMSLKDATLETVLRQLLRAENYVLVYRSDEGGVAGTRLKTIVLLGPRTPSEARPNPVTDKQVKRDYDISQSKGELPPFVDSPPAGQPPPFRSGDRGPTHDWTGKEQIAESTRAAGESHPLAGGLAKGHSRASIEPPPPGAPDPDSVRQQILERVNALVDVVRRATLDAPRGNRHPY